MKLIDLYKQNSKFDDSDGTWTMEYPKIFKIQATKELEEQLNQLLDTDDGVVFRKRALAIEQLFEDLKS